MRQNIKKSSFLFLFLYLSLFSVFSFLHSEEEWKRERKVNVTFTGEKHVQISSEISSTVREVYKKVGDPCKEGELLIALDSSLYEARLFAAQAFQKKAETHLKSQQELHNDGISTPLQVEEAKAEFAQAQMNYVMAKNNLEACFIRAPYDGHITDVWVNNFEQLQPNHPIIDIIYDKILIAKFLIPSKDFSSFYVGQEIAISVIEIDDSITATISNIDSIVDAASSTMRMFAIVPNVEGRLKVGMTGFIRK